MGSRNSCKRIFFIYGLGTLAFLLVSPLWAIFKISGAISGFIKRRKFSVCSPEEHARKVKEVQDQVLQWNREGRKNRMCTARAQWQSMAMRKPAYKATCTGIKVEMYDIVEVDTSRRTVKVEPLMTMGVLSKKLIAMGWMPAVVPELEDLTVGGLICGTGVETSGHKHGLFAYIAVEFEVVVADGRVLTCSKDENADLFHSIPWSHGTLGFLTSATLKIIPAKKYVELEYIPVHSLEEALSVLDSQTYRETGNEFVEGIMYSLDKGVIVVGTPASDPGNGIVNSIGRWYKRWYYKHVESFLSKPPAGRYIEYVPTWQYLHRHQKSGFWEVESGYPAGDWLLFRWLMGWLLPVPYSWLVRLFTPGAIKLIQDVHILQDFLIPLTSVKEFLLYSEQKVGVYPIWLCPTIIYAAPGGMCRSTNPNGEMYVDMGLYGNTTVGSYSFETTGKELESLCIQHRGYQFTYADTQLTNEEFEQMFDHELYYKVRKEYDCDDAFPGIYEKVYRANKTS